MRAFVVSSVEPPSAKVFLENELEAEEERESVVARTKKVERVLGLSDHFSAQQQLAWLEQRRPSISSERAVKTKALQVLGATVQDLRIEKALLVLGEAPGREIPGGKLPKLQQDWWSDAFGAPKEPQWATPPPPPTRASVFLLAFLPWGVLAPLNVIKLQLNKVSPGAHLWVPSETEQCQAACGVARMWATLFWSLQFAGALSCVYLHYRRELGLAIFGTANKVVVGAVLLKAYVDGVIYWPIGLVGALSEWMLALAFIRELRR